MYRKSLIIYSVGAIVFVITMFLLMFLKIDTYDKALLVYKDDMTKIFVDEKSYQKIKDDHNISFSISGKKYQQKILDIQDKQIPYYCIINNIQQYKNKAVQIDLKTGSKRIIF